MKKVDLRVKDRHTGTTGKTMFNRDIRRTGTTNMRLKQEKIVKLVIKLIHFLLLDWWWSLAKTKQTLSKCSANAQQMLSKRSANAQQVDIPNCRYTQWQIHPIVDIANGRYIRLQIKDLRPQNDLKNNLKTTKSLAKTQQKPSKSQAKSYKYVSMYE